MAAFEVPLYLPPVLAFASCVISGLTTFGDGIMFLILWSICGAAGVFDATHPDALSTAVMYVTLLPLTSLPTLLWAARKELKDALGYAACMSITTALMVPVGSYLLLFGDLSILKVAVGIIFLSFAVVKMNASILEAGERRAKARARAKVGEVVGSNSSSEQQPTQSTQQPSGSNDAPMDAHAASKDKHSVPASLQSSMSSQISKAVTLATSVDPASAAIPASTPETKSTTTSASRRGSLERRAEHEHESEGLASSDELQIAVDSDPIDHSSRSNSRDGTTASCMVDPPIVARDAGNSTLQSVELNGVSVLNPAHAQALPASIPPASSGIEVAVVPGTDASASAAPAVARSARAALMAHPLAGPGNRQNSSSTQITRPFSGSQRMPNGLPMLGWNCPSPLMTPARTPAAGASDASGRDLPVSPMSLAASGAGQLQVPACSTDGTALAAAPGQSASTGASKASPASLDHTSVTVVSANPLRAFGPAGFIAGGLGPSDILHRSRLRSTSSLSSSSSVDPSSCCSLAALSRCCGCSASELSGWFPPVSGKYSPDTTAVVLFITGIASGMLGGLYGTGGPPQMVAFAALKLTKESMRGIKVLATTVSNSIRMVMFIAVGTHLFHSDAWPSYLGVAGASIVGAALGSHLRESADAEMILRMLYLLLFATTATMFDAASSLKPALGFSAGAGVWLSVLAIAYYRPQLYRRLTGILWTPCRLGKIALKGSSCCSNGHRRQLSASLPAGSATVR